MVAIGGNMMYNVKVQRKILNKRKVSWIMDDKQINESSHSKEDMARTIVKNMSIQRRESDLHEQDDYDNTHGKNALTDKDFKPKTSRQLSKEKIVLFSILALVLSFALTSYFYGLARLNGKFLPGTYINGGNVTGLTRQEAAEVFADANSDVLPKGVTVRKFGGDSVNIPSDKIGYADNIEKSIAEIYNKQNHYLWFMNIFKRQESEISVEYTYNYDSLEAEVKRRVIDTSLNDASKNAYIEKSGDKFTVVKEIQGGKIKSEDESKVIKYIREQVANGKTEVDISDMDCYEKPDVLSSDLKETCNKLNKLVDIKIVYDFDYAQETLSGKDVLEWITVGEEISNGFTVDDSKAMAYVEKLADKYDTYNKDRNFKSTSRGNMLIKQGKGCYGWWIDQQKTCNALVDTIIAGKSADVKPVYYVSTQTGYEYVGNSKTRTEKSDIGNTYMEIDLKKQHFWYYEKGNLKFESDIVSGKPGDDTSTSAGVYKLWKKEKSKTLSGTADGKAWSSNVTYWCNLGTNGVGLDYSSSQKSYGKEVYKKSGTYGNINMPEKAAKYVYEKVSVGTPCVIYQ